LKEPSENTSKNSSKISSSKSSKNSSEKGDISKVSDNSDEDKSLIVEDPPEKSTISKLKVSLKKSYKAPPQPDEIIEMKDFMGVSDLEELIGMGFDKEKAAAALTTYPSNKAAAIDFLLSDK